MKGLSSQAVTLAAVIALAHAGPADALVYCVTNAADDHRNAPTGDLANSGWQETVEVNKFLGTVIHTNALLTAKHIWELGVGDTFVCEGQTHTLTAKVGDPGSDLAVFFFTPGVTNVARLNIETNDICSFVVLQGRGMERGDAVVTGGRTNGWKWAWDKWYGIRRWGVNRYTNVFPEDETCAVATFDYNGDPDECMLSVGDSGGPGFIRTGSGWKLATVNSSVDPATFTSSTNPVSSFNASLFDCAGLFSSDESGWRFVPPEASPVPCRLLNTRAAMRVAWITNTVAGITFPADLGLTWRCATNAPTDAVAATGLWFEVVATNAGPYTARDVAVDIAWTSGLRVRTGVASVGSYDAGRWSLPAIEDGDVATLRVDAVVWRSNVQWGTNRAWVSSSDKPDAVASNSEAACAVRLPSTATRVLIQ